MQVYQKVPIGTKNIPQSIKNTFQQSKKIKNAVFKPFGGVLGGKG